MSDIPITQRSVERAAEAQANTGSEDDFDPEIAAEIGAAGGLIMPGDDDDDEDDVPPALAR